MSNFRVGCKDMKKDIGVQTAKAKAYKKEAYDKGKRDITVRGAGSGFP